MAMDVVHDTQKGYRTILHCMSRPGTIENVSEIADKVTVSIECLSATFVTSLTLLDREVSFSVVGGDTKKMEELFVAYTMATSASLKTADYVFITKQASKEQIISVFQNVKTGTLINPQQSATIILETEYLSNSGNLLLTGPGIEDTEEVSIANNEYWLEARNNVNSEYPLGVDMILLDEFAHVMCLPRTTVTKIREV